LVNEDVKRSYNIIDRNTPDTGIACSQSIVARNEMIRLEWARWRRKFATDFGFL
jgi:hypothetical protein